MKEKAGQAWQVYEDGAPVFERCVKKCQLGLERCVAFCEHAKLPPLMGGYGFLYEWELDGRFKAWLNLRGWPSYIAIGDTKIAARLALAERVEGDDTARHTLDLIIAQLIGADEWPRGETSRELPDALTLEELTEAQRPRV